MPSYPIINYCMTCRKDGAGGGQSGAGRGMLSKYHMKWCKYHVIYDSNSSAIFLSDEGYSSKTVFLVAH